MALLPIDASTPAAVHGASASTSVTTASFTPPDGSAIIVCAGVNGSIGSTAVSISTPTDNLGSHLTYTLVSSQGLTATGADAIAYVWRASVTTGAAMTITITKGGGNIDNLYLYLRVLVFAGAAATPIGASGGGRNATGVIGDTYSSTVVNSSGWLLISDWSAQTVTVGSGETIQDSYVVGGQISYALIQQSALTAASGTSVTMSTTAPTSAAQQSHIYFEVVPLLVGPTIGSVPSGTAQTAGALSAKFLFFDTGDYSPGL